MAKNEGKQFEADFEESCERSSHFFLRLIDSAKWVQGEEASFTPENPSDCILHTIPFLWMLELKSTKGASISFFPSTPDVKPKGTKTQKMIKPNQVKSLMKAVKNKGIVAGFIFNYRPRQLKSGLTENKVYFVHINDFMEFARRTGKASISQEDCNEIGIEISGKIKKVHYKYDIDEFVDRAITYYMNKGYIGYSILVKLQQWLGNVLDGGVFGIG